VTFGSTVSADPEILSAIAVMALAALAAKGGGFVAMRWLGRHRFVGAWLQNAPGAVLVSAAVVPVLEVRGAFIVGAIAGALVTRTTHGFTAGLFAAVLAVALARWAGLS
jgi:uncharacterized membrane protein